MSKNLAHQIASQRPSLRVLLLIILFTSAVASVEAYAGSKTDLSGKEVKRGESIISKLLELGFAPTDSRTRHKLIQKMYPRLFSEVAELEASDLKTDLTTAVFLYEEAWREESRSGEIDCAGEPRKVYAKLCAAKQGATISDFLRAKARLHTEWAVAIIGHHRGIVDAATALRLEEIRNERTNDLRLAVQAVAALKTVEQNVRGYESLGELEEHRALATVPFERLSNDVSEMLGSVDRILLSMPRSPLFYSLYHARNSYTNGLFWWQKTHHLKRLVVNANSFTEPADMEASKLDPKVVNYTVAINWRNAIRHTRAAVNIIEAFKQG